MTVWWEQHWPELAALVAIVFHAGVSYSQLRAVNNRLDKVNGRLDNHGDRLSDAERDLANVRGRMGL
jgi:hypothetical protein